MLIPCIIVINGRAKCNQNGLKEIKVSKMIMIDLLVSFLICLLNRMKLEDKVIDLFTSENFHIIGLHTLRV
jgi:hypothetical protein